MIGLVRSGRSPEELSREFEPAAQTIRNWVAAEDRAQGRVADGANGWAPRERELRRELREERRKNGILREDGVPRIRVELRERGVRVSRKRVSRLMREAGLGGVAAKVPDADDDEAP